MRLAGAGQQSHHRAQAAAVDKNHLSEMQHEILAVSHQSCHMRPQGFRFTAGDDPSAALNNCDRSHSPRVEYKWHGENPVLSQTLLLWHHLASQVASNNLAKFASLLRCLKGRFP